MKIILQFQRYSSCCFIRLMKYCFYCLVFLQPVLLAAQTLWFQDFSTRNGLPSNEIYQTFQDSKGFLWFCTDQGLARYNGYAFDYFSTEDGLTDNTIFNAHEDEQGRIWWVTFRGGLCYYENNQFKAHPANAAIIELCQEDYLSNLCSHGDTLFFAPKNTFVISEAKATVQAHEVAYYYSTKQDSTIHKVSLNDQLPIQQIPPNYYSYEYSFTPIGNHQLLYLGISHYRSNTKFSFPDSFSMRYRSNRWLLGATPMGHQNIGPHTYLLYTQHRIGLFKDRQIVQEALLPSPTIKIYHAIQDQQSNIWVATSKGLFLYPNGDLNQAPQHFLSEYIISHIQEDSEGNLWFSTLNNGVKMLSKLTIRQYRPKQLVEFSRLLSINDQYLLSLTKTGQLYQLSSQHTLIPLDFLPYNQQNAPMGIGVWDEKQIILGNGLKVDLVNQKATPYINRSNSKAFFYHKTLQKLFVGSHQGIQYQTENTLHPTNYTERVSIFHPHHVDSNLLWIGSSKGLAIYNMEEDSFHQYEPPLLTKRILDIGATSKGTLFLATKGAGLVIKQGNNIHHISSKQGLCSNFIQCIGVENDSTIWVGSQRGLNKITWNDNDSINPIVKIAQYTEASGLPSNTINDILVRNKQLYLASDMGIIQFQTQSTSPHIYEIPIYSLPLQINGKSILMDSSYNLTSTQKNIRFNFSAIHFQDAHNVVYRYQLRGKDTTWTISTNRSIQYTNLAPGSYEFIAMARNNNGDWSQQNVRIPFTIHPHFSETWWFFIVITLLTFSIVGWLIYLYIAYIKERINIEKMHIESEQKALRSQMNPHFIFNALNSVLYFIRKNNREAASNYLNDFSTLIRTILRHSKEEFVPLQDELENIQIYMDLEEQRLTNPYNSHDFSIQIEQGFSVLDWQIPPMLIQPLIENAIRHGLENKEGERILEVTIDGVAAQHLVISVTDNGIGREAAQVIKKRRQSSKKHNSTGLENITNRLTTLSYLYKEHFSIATEDLFHHQKACGTRYSLHIPYIKPKV